MVKNTSEYMKGRWKKHLAFRLENRETPEFRLIPKREDEHSCFTGLYPGSPSPGSDLSFRSIKQLQV